LLHSSGLAHSTPNDLKDFAQSVFAAATFSSNFLFWRESGYFATTAELKPLLHTWSLAVEEQYYIIFPLFMIIAWRYFKASIQGLLALIFFLSFALSQYAAYNHPSANFFLLPTRGWELIIGVFVALYIDKLGFSDRINCILSFLGSGFIIIAAFTFSDSTPFPSAYALLPTVGTALVIIGTSSKNIVRVLLRSRPVVFIGLLSYSLYLTHQPVFSFWRQLSGRIEISAQLTELLIITSIFALISYYLIERPFRGRKSTSGRDLLFTLGATASVLIAMGTGIHFFFPAVEKFWLSQQETEIKQTYSVISSTEKSFTDGFIEQDNGECRFNVRNLELSYEQRFLDCYATYGPSTLILGDSHAWDLYGVVTAASSEPFLVGVTKGGCRPHTPKSNCHYDEVLKFVKSYPNVFDRVVYEQAGFYLAKNASGSKVTRSMFSDVPLNSQLEGLVPDRQFIKATHQYLETLSKHVSVGWYGSRMEPHISQNDVLKLGCDNNFALRDGQEVIFRSIDSAISTLTVSSAVDFLSQNDDIKFAFRHDFMTCEEIFWADGDHFSARGEKYFSGRLSLEFFDLHH
jgi:peptidoglycan/LPS O-acetylase OafA/YrhL